MPQQLKSALARQDLVCTHLTRHELESILIIVIIITVILSFLLFVCSGEQAGPDHTTRCQGLAQ